jgi:tRNA A37 threonylcarbamoyladenosine dehydratase
MGMAQKMDPARLKTAGIWETCGCPLARLVRQGLRKRGFAGSFTAVYSDERLPRREEAVLSCGSKLCLCSGGSFSGNAAGLPGGRTEWCGGKKIINGSAVTVTAAAGMILASLVLRDIMGRL